jgi:hypothetical protein
LCISVGALTFITETNRIQFVLSGIVGPFVPYLAAIDRILTSLVVSRLARRTGHCATRTMTRTPVSFGIQSPVKLSAPPPRHRSPRRPGVPTLLESGGKPMLEWCHVPVVCSGGERFEAPWSTDPAYDVVKGMLKRCQIHSPVFSKAQPSAALSWIVFRGDWGLVCGTRQRHCLG